MDAYTTYHILIIAYIYQFLNVTYLCFFIFLLNIFSMLFLQHSPIIIDIFNNLYIFFFDVICIGGSLLINMTVSLIFHELVILFATAIFFTLFT